MTSYMNQNFLQGRSKPLYSKTSFSIQSFQAVCWYKDLFVHLVYFEFLIQKTQ